MDAVVVPSEQPLDLLDVLPSWTSSPRLIHVDHDKDEENLCRFVTAAAGESHTLLLTHHGVVYSMGSNTYGQLGRRLASDDVTACGCRVQPVTQCVSYALSSPLPTITRVAAGKCHSALISHHGELWTFGWGLYQQLGHDQENQGLDNQALPTCVTSLCGIGAFNPVTKTFEGLQAVACGAWHTAALSTTGELYTFGWNADGQLGYSSEVFPSQGVPQLVSDASFESDEKGHAIVQIVCGTRHTTALCHNGRVLTWGFQISPVPTPGPVSRCLSPRLRQPQGRHKVVSLAAGGWRTLALLERQEDNGQEDNGQEEVTAEAIHFNGLTTRVTDLIT